LSTNVNVAFLWAANGSVPTVSTLMTSTPPGYADTLGLSAMAWEDILADPNFTLAVNNANSGVAVAQSAANGSLNYNGGAAFGVSGTSPGVTYSLFMIGWSTAYATPAIAAATDSFVGWSAPFSYRCYQLTEAPTSFAGLTGQFGVGGLPEPSTLVLASLGGLTLLLLRRRK